MLRDALMSDERYRLTDWMILYQALAFREARLEDFCDVG